MPRPQKDRKVAKPPIYSCFKPAGIRRRGLDKVFLKLDEYEAVRLADHEGMEHSEASELMHISRSTFTRLIEKARGKLAEFIIEGKQLQIEGGSVHFSRNIYKCNKCGNIITATIDKVISKCPKCKSSDLTDLANDHGHGDCCREFNEK